MLKKIGDFILKNSALILCGVVVMAAPLISEGCQVFWYQQEEPEGLREFAGEKRRMSIRQRDGI